MPSSESTGPNVGDYEVMFAAVYRPPAHTVRLDSEWYCPRRPRHDPYWAPPGNWSMFLRLVARLSEAAREVCATVAAELAVEHWLLRRPTTRQDDGPQGGSDGETGDAGWHPLQLALAGDPSALKAMANKSPIERRWRYDAPTSLNDDRLAEHAVQYAVRVAHRGDCEEAVAAAMASWPKGQRDFLVTWWRWCCARLAFHSAPTATFGE